MSLPSIAAGRIFTLVFMLLFVALIIVYVQLAKRGKKFFLRKIAGLDVIDEAIGRAAEMGRPVHFSTGVYAHLTTVEAPQTLAGIACLEFIAHSTARLGVPLHVSVSKAEALPLITSTVREAYFAEGKSEHFNLDNIHYFSDDLYAYDIGMGGVVERNKVASNFIIGPIAVESIYITEIGNRIGAFQVAGTARTVVICNLIATCDYVLIGEEIFAARAYITKEPIQVGNIAGTDACKLLTLAVIALAFIVSIFGVPTIVDLLKM